MSLFSVYTALADLVRMAKIIVWDKAPIMSHRFRMKACDRTLQDIMGTEKPFGDKVIVLSGDFRQCLPVIPHSCILEITNAAVQRSTI